MLCYALLQRLTALTFHFWMSVAPRALMLWELLTAFQRVGRSSLDEAARWKLSGSSSLVISVLPGPQVRMRRISAFCKPSH